METKPPMLPTEDFVKIIIFLVLLIAGILLFNSAKYSHDYRMRQTELCEKIGGYVVHGVCAPPHQVREGVK